MRHTNALPRVCADAYMGSDCDGLLPQVPKGSVQNCHKSTANRGAWRPFPTFRAVTFAAGGTGRLAHDATGTRR